MRWLFLESPPDDGPGNMALDEALMSRAARTGEAVFRVYSWRTPTLSLGRNQRARGDYDLDAARTLGVAFVRRPTGGRALLHDHEITYSATLPATSAADADAAYAFLNDVLLAAISALGVRATRAAATQSIPPGLRPCFDAPSEHEIVVGERKLVGSAQWRRGGALLQHGSILVRDDQPMIARVMKSPITTPPAATLVDALGREPTVSELAALLRASLSRIVDATVTTLDDPRITGDTEALRAT
ncbi:MAG TPA: lipoate--protein ligase family protein, partial [Gemmatimonadaceae bacterium]